MDGQQTSIYGTLPRAKRIRSRKDKKSPQQMAQIIADYIVYEAQQVLLYFIYGKHII